MRPAQALGGLRIASRDRSAIEGVRAAVREQSQGVGQIGIAEDLADLRRAAVAAETRARLFSSGFKVAVGVLPVRRE